MGSSGVYDEAFVGADGTTMGRGIDPPGRSFDDDEHGGVGRRSSLLLHTTGSRSSSSFLMSSPSLLILLDDDGNPRQEDGAAEDLLLENPPTYTEEMVVTTEPEEDDDDDRGGEETPLGPALQLRESKQVAETSPYAEDDDDDAEDQITFLPTQQQPEQNPQDPQDSSGPTTITTDMGEIDLHPARTYIKNAVPHYAGSGCGSIIIEPGAYLVIKTKRPGKELVSITVPTSVRPNELFEVRLGLRRVRIVCPFTAPPGSRLSVQVDREDIYSATLLKPGILTASPVAVKFFGRRQLPQQQQQQQQQQSSPPSSSNLGLIGGAYPIIPGLKQVYRDAKQDAPNVRTQIITIPNGAVPGEKFEYHNPADGKRYRLLCPTTSRPGDRLRMAIKGAAPVAETPASHQKIPIIIPSDATPGAAFAVQLSSWPSPITVSCPLDARPGDFMELTLPTDQVLSAIQVRYPSESWVRTVRFDDLKFQWVLLRGENSSIVDENQQFHFYKSAFCRTVRWLEGNDPRLYTGGLSLVPAAQAVVESRLVVDPDTTVTYADLSLLQGCPRIDKHEWFLEMCKKMVKKDDTHVKIAIRRGNLLPDSLKAIMCLAQDDLRRVWEIKFIGEEVHDHGGPMKEWFEIVTTRLLDPDAGYFVFSASNAAAVEINPTSYILCAEDHLLYYRFLGRLLGRALFCGHLIKGHFTQLFFKFLLGWPINSMDIADAALYKSLMAIANADDVEGHNYTFTVSENAFFKHVDHELIDHGLTTFVSLENRDLFLEKMIRYYLFERTLPQLTEVMLGFLDVVPEPLLTIFDASELELILCGLPRIDVFDWQANTTYRGLFAEKGPMEPTVQWFWQVVEEFDLELRARLLQFATGSSGVPFLGFQYLRGQDDQPSPFTIEGVPASLCYYPKAHACFNKIDLPVFDSIEALRERLTFSITTAFVGFNDE